MSKHCIQQKAAKASQSIDTKTMAEWLKSAFLHDVNVRKCFQPNIANTLLNEASDIFYFYIQKINRNDKCDTTMEIDTDEYCIGDVRFGRLQTPWAQQYPECQSNKKYVDPADNKWWWLRASGDSWWLSSIERDTSTGQGYTGYHPSRFDEASDVIVYVLDDRVDLNHPEFKHLTDKVDLTLSSSVASLSRDEAIEKSRRDGSYIFDVNGHWGDEQADHGKYVADAVVACNASTHRVHCFAHCALCTPSHVAGLIVGRRYGVLKQKDVPLRVYAVCGYRIRSTGSAEFDCPEAAVAAGLAAVIKDMRLDTNRGKRAVINLSWGSYVGENAANDPSSTLPESVWLYDES